jgi:hypothetical protein
MHGILHYDSNVILVFAVSSSFSHFLIARMKDQIVTDRQLVSTQYWHVCTVFMITACTLNIIVRACRGNYQQIKNSQRQKWYVTMY